MRTKIVEIGNSQGIRLPKLILQQIGAENEVDLEVNNNRIILEPIDNLRRGWAEAFRKMAKNGDDQLLNE